MEQESREESGAARSRHVVHLVPRDPAQAARVLAGPLGRDAGAPGALSAIVVTPGADDSVALGEALARQESGAQPVVLTSARRAPRLLGQRPRAIVADAALLGQLVAQAQLSLGDVHFFALLWAEDLAEGESGEALASVLADLPRDADRLALAGRETGALEAFLERAMWRARRVRHTPHEPPADLPLRFVLTSEAHRAAALGATLDALDPATAHVAAFTDAGEAEARTAAAALGYGPDGDTLRVARGLPDIPVDLVVLFELPPERELLERAASLGSTIVVLVAPAQLPALRALAGPTARPQPVGDLFTAARTRAERLRSEVRTMVRRGAHQAYMLTLEPLVAEFDPIEIAAAALASLERERAAKAAPAPAPVLQPTAAPPRAAGDQRMTRVFVNVGERDGVRRGDLVGAIAGEAEISGAEIGRIELRDSHAIVEVASDVAPKVIERLTGIMIRGRRVAARADREPVRSRPAGRPSGRPAGRPAGRPGGRPASRGSERSESGRREPRDRGDRPRTAPPDRLPRATHEADEWADRAERLRNARRPADEEASE